MRQAGDLLLQMAIETKTDILILSELPRNLIQGSFIDASKRAGIWICNRECTVEQYSVEEMGFVWVEIADVRYYSCYFSPNDPIEKFTRELDLLETSFRNSSKNFVIAGDFNAKSPDWQETRLDKRGQLVSEMIARNDLVIVNQGSANTFSRGDACSIIDLTIASTGIVGNIEGWRVLDEETLSDHKYIEFWVSKVESEVSTANTSKGWNAKFMNNTKFRDSLTYAQSMRELKELWCKQKTGGEDRITENIGIIRKACDKAMPRKKFLERKAPKYWWTEEIGNIRKECFRAWRQSVRSRGDMELRDRHKQLRKKLRRAIISSQKRQWEELIRKVDDDPWGLGYKIVTKKLRIRKQVPELNDMRWVKTIIRDLFPKQDLWKRVKADKFVFREDYKFTLDEINNEIRNSKTAKAPGPDGIPNEAVRLVIKSCPELLLDMFNDCLSRGVFPKVWKVQSLILLRKGDKPLNETSSFRPICLLDTLGKLFEGLILQRLRKHMEGKHSDRQFGFRRGKSTVDAIKAVVDLAKEKMRGNGRRKGFCALVSLDISNAFNSVRWKDFLLSLEEKQVPEYLLRVIEDYLNERFLVYNGYVEKITGGAAQGSRMGPELWNISYDSFLEMPLPRDSTVYGFADDALMMFWGQDIENLEIRINDGLNRAKFWTESRGLRLAASKTQAVLLTQRRNYALPKIKLGISEIQWQNHITYLGVEIDKRLSFAPHLERAMKKALASSSGLARLMPRMGGPRESRRRLLGSVAQSKLLYAAPIWASTLDAKNRVDRILSVQRVMTSRIVSSYRTVSTSALQVLAKTPPMDLLVKERAEIYKKLTECESSLRADESVRNRIKSNVREDIIGEWQQRWENDNNGRWTFSLIPKLEKWIKRKHGDIGYYLTQALSGHGSFRYYLWRFKIAENSCCSYCGCEIDDAEHTLFACENWAELREALEIKLSVKFTKSNMISQMLISRERWNAVETFVITVIRKKESDEWSSRGRIVST